MKDSIINVPANIEPTINEDECDDNEVTQADTSTMSKIRYLITLGNYKIILRTKPKVLRYVNYNKKVDCENYYREQLLLYIPWRDEENYLLNGFKTYQDHFKSKHDKISKKKEYDANFDLIDDVEAAAEKQSIDIFDDVCPNIESNEARDAQEEPTTSVEYKFYDPQTRNHAFYDLAPDIGAAPQGNNIEMVQSRLSEKDYLELVPRLNIKQRKIVTHIVHSITNNPDKQLCLFITGGAEVGKSMLQQAFTDCAVQNLVKTLI